MYNCYLLFSVCAIFERIKLIIHAVDPIAANPANIETKATFNGSSMKAFELLCSALVNAIAVSIGARVVSVGDVPDVEVLVVVSSLGADATDNATEARIDVFAFKEPNESVNGCFVVFENTVLTVLVVKFVVVSYMGVISSIDEETYAPSIDESVAILDAFDDLHVVVVC